MNWTEDTMRREIDRLCRQVERDPLDPTAWCVLVAEHERKMRYGECPIIYRGPEPISDPAVWTPET